jgi:hypothetical protein
VAATAERTKAQLAYLEKASAAFADVVKGELTSHPTLTCAGFPPGSGLAEFSISLDPSPGYGVVHEEIIYLAKVAADHDARLFVDGKSGQLCIVWSEHPSKGPAEAEQS